MFLFDSAIQLNCLNRVDNQKCQYNKDRNMPF